MKGTERAVVTVLAMLVSSAAFAQLLYFPAIEFGRPFPNVPHGIGHPGPMATFGGAPVYEPFQNFADTERYGKIGAAVGRLDLLLDVHQSDTVVSYCTATLISEDVIVTNYHCVPGLNPNVTVIAAELRMGLHHDPDEPGEAFQIADLRPLDVHRDLDFVLLRVQGNPGRTYGYVRLDPRDPRDNEPLFIVHHSLGLPKMLTRRNCSVFKSDSAADLAGQQAGPNTVRYDPDTDVTHRCDAQGGSSGALVFSQIDDRVVGLHFAGTNDNVPPDRRFNLFKRFTLIAERSAVLASIVRGDPPTPTERHTLSITSVPAGATVLAANQAYGVTPLELWFPSPGSLTITLRLSGFADHSSVVAVRPGHNQYAVTLTPTGSPPPSPTPSPPPPFWDSEREISLRDYLANVHVLRDILRRGGGYVWLGEGVFEFPSTIDIRQDVTVVGAGQGRTVLRLRSGANVISYLGVFEVSNGAQVEFSHLTIEGNGVSSHPSAVVYVADGTINLQDVTLRDARTGLSLRSSSAGFIWWGTTFESVSTGVSCDRGSDLFLFGEDPAWPIEGSREYRTFFLGCDP